MLWRVRKPRRRDRFRNSPILIQEEAKVKKLVIAALLALMLVLPTQATVFAAPTTFTVSYNQAQFQWRAAWHTFGDWGWVNQNYATTSEFRLTGNTLHTAITYSPTVTDLQGASTVYTYNKASGKLIQHEGTIQYTSPYSGLPITEYWRGYLDFGGATPSASSFVHGVGYQWGYVYGVDEITVKKFYVNALLDSTVGAWLVGFSIYLWDSGAQIYDVESPYTNPPFPSPFIEPVPASNWNPLGL